MTIHQRRILLVLILFLSANLFTAKSQDVKPYQDVKHLSHVFGKEKTYRIYLPGDYGQTQKKYPVVYFFHGWGGRYFKDDSAKLEYEMLGKLVDKYQAILVMWDGNIDESEPRPYNIGSHSDVKFQVQMKDYFPELVAHIDSKYQTLNDRDHRGIIGFSMGGFMSFYLAGKYPDWVSAAVNMVGSPEFFVGLPENHTLYQMRYTFDNLRDVSLLFHNRTNCPMSGLNDETNNGAIWSELQNYEYHKLAGDHKVDEPGQTKIFDSAMKFVTDRFANPVPLQKSWSHYDLCPEFDIWGYSVKSAKSEPGFIFLKDADKNGFGFYTHQWLPSGPAVKKCKTTITTAPVYLPNTKYSITVYTPADSKIKQYDLQTDGNGRLQIDLVGDDCEVAISGGKHRINFSSIGYELSGKRQYLRVNKPEELSVRIFNRGGSLPENKKIKLKLSSADKTVSFQPEVQEITVKDKTSVFSSAPFKVLCTKTPPADGSPEWLRLHAEIELDGLHFSDIIVVPVFYDVPEFENVRVDDGRAVAPTRNQSDFSKSAIDVAYGSGNGNGVVSPGERVMLYEGDHRLRLFSNDPYVVQSEEKLIDEFLPGQWPDGFTLSSVVKIADNCPAGHEIVFLAHYETKTFMPMYRQVKWGKVKLRVQPNPKTKP